MAQAKLKAGGELPRISATSTQINRLLSYLPSGLGHGAVLARMLTPLRLIGNAPGVLA